MYISPNLLPPESRGIGLLQEEDEEHPAYGKWPQSYDTYFNSGYPTQNSVVKYNSSHPAWEGKPISQVRELFCRVVEDRKMQMYTEDDDGELLYQGWLDLNMFSSVAHCNNVSAGRSDDSLYSDQNVIVLKSKLGGEVHMSFDTLDEAGDWHRLLNNVIVEPTRQVKLKSSYGQRHDAGYRLSRLSDLWGQCVRSTWNGLLPSELQVREIFELYDVENENRLRPPDMMMLWQDLFTMRRRVLLEHHKHLCRRLHRAKVLVHENEEVQELHDLGIRVHHRHDPVLAQGPSRLLEAYDYALSPAGLEGYRNHIGRLPEIEGYQGRIAFETFASRIFPMLFRREQLLEEAQIYCHGSCTADTSETSGCPLM